MLFCALCCCAVVGPKDTAPEEVFKVTFSAYERYLPFLYAKEKEKAV